MDAKRSADHEEKPAKVAKVESNDGDKKERSSKKKFAIMFGYCGTGYSGLQINGDVPTIERDLFGAICKAGMVSEMNQVDQKKVGLQRACRTDKNVHAAGNVVSIKIKNAVQRINEHLPDTIRVFKLIPTARGFNPKNACESRVYEYILPTYVLKPCVSSHDELEERLKLMTKDVESGKYCPPTEKAPVSEKDLEELKSYRISDDDVKKFTSLLENYEGTHSFHNFTVAKIQSEMQKAKRFIISFKCGKPFIRSDCEWVSLKIHGQSFMMHQIRKMIGFCVLIMRYQLEVDTIWPRVFLKLRWNVPKVPGVGLLLEQPFYPSHNKKFKDLYDPIDFSTIQNQVDDFKSNFIYETIFKDERDTNEFYHWLRCLDEHLFDYRYLCRDIEDLELESKKTFKFTIKEEKEEEEEGPDE